MLKNNLGANAPKLPTWQQYCKEIGADKSTVNRWLTRWFGPQLTKKGIIDLPKGIFDVIYADPPWQYDNSIREWGPASLHYPTMSFERLCEFIGEKDNKGRILNDCIAENAVLFLWVTNPFLREGLELCEAWSFNFKTSLVWVKRNLKRPGSGFYVRGHHEHLFIATRGSMVPNQTGKKPISSVIDADIGKHSEKPKKVYEIIEEIYPHHKYLELFARKARKGWISWGNEQLKRLP